MAGPAMTYSMVDYADVQGLVRFGYGHMTSASYALVRVKNKAAAKAWLRSAPITTAVAQKPPQSTEGGCWVMWIIMPPSSGIGAAPRTNHISW